MGTLGFQKDKQEDSRSNQARTISGGRKVETEAALLSACPEKAGFAGKDSDGGRQQEKRKAEYERE